MQPHTLITQLPQLARFAHLIPSAPHSGAWLRFCWSSDALSDGTFWSSDALSDGTFWSSDALSEVHSGAQMLFLMVHSGAQMLFLMVHSGAQMLFLRYTLELRGSI